MKKHRFPALVTFVLVSLMVALTSACPPGGTLEVRARPKEAYVFLDGVPMGDVSRTDGVRVLIVGISPGEHTVGIYNYGFKPDIRKVTIAAGKRTVVTSILTPEGGPVAGPFGRIEFKGGALQGSLHYAVLLNGKTPDFFVGDTDEFNNDFMGKQQLLVPPGTHQVTLMKYGQVAWSGAVTVAANQNVVVHINEGGKQETKSWPQGEGLHNLPRFKAGIASATVAVAPVTGKFGVDPTQVNCGGSAHLTWSTDGAVTNEISGIGTVALSGDQTVQPKQTTDYKMTAAGPGGVLTSDATVTVNTAIPASLSVSPTEVRYRKLDNNVVEQGSATVAWSASNADTVSVDPFGSVAASGDRTIQVTPTKTTLGPVDETLTYTLTASNACGGTATQTATLHITGSIEETPPPPRLALNSIYFPTNLPTKANPNGGLEPSQQDRLNTLVSDFKQYLVTHPNAHMVLLSFQGHADRRGSAPYNMALSQRRADRVKNFLIEAGIPESVLETKAFGKEQELTSAEIKQLNEQNPNLTPQDRKRLQREWAVFVLANNRRVDVVLTVTGQESLRYYPFNSEDVKILLSLHQPSEHVAKAGKKKTITKTITKKAEIKKTATK